MYLMEKVFDGTLVKEYARKSKKLECDIDEEQEVQIRENLEKLESENNIIQKRNTETIDVLKKSIQSIPNDKNIVYLFFT